MKARKKYEASFKAETVKLSKEIGISKVSADLGVPEDTIRNRIRANKTRSGNPIWEADENIYRGKMQK